MEPALKTRLIGAAVLVAVAVIVVPMFFPGTPPGTGKDQTLSLDIPPAPTGQMQSRTLSVAPPAAGTAATPVQGSDHVATVNVQSRVPQDVHPELDAPAQSSSQVTTVTPDHQQVAPTSTQPPAPAPQPQATKPTPAKPVAKPSSPAPVAVEKPKASEAPGAAAQGRYEVSLGAYANKNNAAKLMTTVRGMGYPVQVSAVSIGGKPAAKVVAGPFASRAAAEAARLKIKSKVPGVPTSLTASASEQKNDAPASALPAGRAGGWAVQLAAYGSRTDADALRDRLRKAGYDGYVEQAPGGSHALWRVRVGPETSRESAEALRKEIDTKMKLHGVIVTAH